MKAIIHVSDYTEVHKRNAAIDRIQVRRVLNEGEYTIRGALGTIWPNGASCFIGCISNADDCVGYHEVETC